DEGDAVAGLDLPQVRERLVAPGVVRSEHHDRQVLIDQRDRAVLHLPRRITLGVDIGDFLQLQGTFERYRVVQPATQEEKVPRVVKVARQLLDPGLESQRLLDRDRKVNERRALSGGQAPGETPRLAQFRG